MSDNVKATLTHMCFDRFFIIRIFWVVFEIILCTSLLTAFTIEMIHFLLLMWYSK